MADTYLTIEPVKQTLTHAWKTTIQTSLDGSKQRSSLFSWPRLRMNNQFKCYDFDKINWLKRHFYKNSHKIWGIPIWVDKTVLTASEAPPSALLNVDDTTDRHFYEGRKVILINPAASFPNYEVLTISSLTSDTISTTSAVVGTWPVGTYVLPLYECRITANQTFQQSGYKEMSFSLEASESFEATRTFNYILPSSGAVEYLGHDVLLQSPTYPITHGFNHPYEMSSFLGLSYAYSHYDDADNSMYLDLNFTFDDRSDLWDCIDFFDNKRGRLINFWMPSWNRDIIVNSGFDSTDTILNIDDIEYSTYYLSNDIINRHVIVSFPDRTYALRKITGATSNSITLDSAIGTSVKTDQLGDIFISFLNFGHFSTDTLEIDYLKEWKSNVKLKFEVLLGESL